MANIYKVNSDDLTAVADAIRTQTGKTDQLVYPDDFIAEIDALELSKLPKFTFNGLENSPAVSLKDEGDGNWTLSIFETGTINFSKLDTPIDVFCVGGGGSGGCHTDSNYYGGGGGGGGKTITSKNLTILTDSDYTITIGAGGGFRTKGGTTSAFGVSADGGSAGSAWSAGGSGGSGGGAGGYYNTSANYGGKGGSDGSAGSNSGTSRSGGTGQGSTTRAFGEDAGTLYSGGGGGGRGQTSGGSKGQSGVGGEGGGGDGGVAGDTNTGGGGGGALAPNKGTGGKSGGSGIILIRNSR